MLKTTLNEIKAHSPCADFWEKLLKSLGKTKADDEPLGLDYILESNGVSDCVWSLCTQPNGKLIALEFAIFCAERVLPLYEESNPDDNHPREAIEAARQYLKDPSEDNAWAASRAAAAADVAYAFAIDASIRAAAAAADAAYAFSTASRAAYAATYAGAAADAAIRAGAAAWTSAAAARAASRAADAASRAFAAAWAAAASRAADAASRAAYAAYAGVDATAEKQELLRLLKEQGDA